MRELSNSSKFEVIQAISKHHSSVTEEAQQRKYLKNNGSRKIFRKTRHETPRNIARMKWKR